LCPIGRAGTDRLHHALDAEFVSLGVQRFGHAVGIENEAIVAFERDSEVSR
jgi:hypothetical protein